MSQFKEVQTFSLPEEWASLKEFFRTDPEAKEALADLKRVLPAGLIAGYILNKARRARKRGDYKAAIYFVILWAGFSNNFNNTEVLREIKKGNKPIVKEQDIDFDLGFTNPNDYRNYFN